MAGSQITIMASQVEAQRLGYMGLSLTEWNTLLEPQIGAGGVVELGSALFEFTVLESITGWAGIANNSDVYVALTVAGASITASFTTAAPTWDASKVGWYNGGLRYVFKLRKDSVGAYAEKRLLHPVVFRLNPKDVNLTTFVAESGSEVIFAADVERNTSLTYQKVKEIVIPFSGVVSVVFDLRRGVSGQAFGQIYKNGTAVGTEQNTVSAAYVTFTEDISVSRGDLLQLYIRHTNSGFARNFRIRTSTPIAGTLLELMTGPIMN